MLVYANAAKYNKPETYYYKLAKRLQYATTPLIRKLREQADKLGIHQVGDVLERDMIEDMFTPPPRHEICRPGYQIPGTAAASPYGLLGRSMRANHEDEQPRVDGVSVEEQQTKDAVSVKEKPKSEKRRRTSSGSTSRKTQKGDATGETRTQTDKNNKKRSKRASDKVTTRCEYIIYMTHRFIQRTTTVPSTSSDEQTPTLAFGDVVWAKMMGFPWFPAEIVDPSGEIPPALHKYREPGKDWLVCFFDRNMERRSWQWLAREALVPLGQDDERELGFLRLRDYRKSKSRAKKAVHEAYRMACKELGIDPDRLLSQV
jgi:hypothetical protein